MAACDMGKWDGMVTRRDTGMETCLFSPLLVEPAHTRDTRGHTRTGTRITQTNLTAIPNHQRTHTHDRATTESAAGCLTCVPLD